MALYIPHSIFHLARLLYVMPETFGPYYAHTSNPDTVYLRRDMRIHCYFFESKGFREHRGLEKSALWDFW